MYTPMPPMNPEVARLRRQAAQRKYMKGLRYVRCLWGVAGLLLIILLVEVAVAMCFSPRFWVYRLEVTGNETLTNAELIRLTRLPAKSNYFRTSLHELAKRVLQEPRVQRVAVRRLNVGVLGIEVAERQPVCRLGHTLPLTYLDAEGNLFIRPIPPTVPVPEVEGVQVPPDGKLGKQLKVPGASAVVNCLAAYRNNKEPDDPELMISRLVMTPEGKLIMVVTQGTRIYLGDPTDLERKMWVVRKTVQEAQKKGFPLENIDYIDAKVIERLTSSDDNKDPNHPMSLGAVFKPRVDTLETQQTEAPSQ